MIRIGIYSASPFARAGLEQALAADPRFEVAGRGSHDEADEAPDVVLVDGMAEDIAKLQSVRISADPLRFVLLTDAVDSAALGELVPLGVRAILPRDSTSTEIGAAVEAVAAGLMALTPEWIEDLLPADRNESGPADLHEHLTAREMEVLALLAEGEGNKEIADRLNISENTAKFHVSSILGKLGATTRTEAVSRGYRLGLILI